METVIAIGETPDGRSDASSQAEFLAALTVVFAAASVSTSILRVGRVPVRVKSGAFFVRSSWIVVEDG